MLRCDLNDFDLWPHDLEHLLYIKCNVINVRTKFERNWAILGWIIHNFSNFLHTLCNAVTLTFGLLTLNFYSTSDVMRLKVIQNLSEIE